MAQNNPFKSIQISMSFQVLEFLSLALENLDKNSKCYITNRKYSHMPHMAIFATRLS